MRPVTTPFGALALIALLALIPAPALSQAPSFITSWGSQGSGPGQFLDANDVIVDSHGNVYVADTGNNRIQKFTNEGVFICEWGGYGSAPGQMIAPLRLAFSPEGDVCVADIDNRRIQKLTPTGNWLASYGSRGDLPGQFDSWPIGFAVSSSGEVYASQFMNENLDRFAADGSFLSRVRLTTPESPGGVWGAMDMALSPDGRLYLAIPGNSIFVFDAEGAFLSQWSRTAHAITVASNGHLLGVDGGTVWECLLDGTLVGSWVSPSTGPGAFTYGSGIAVDENENIYITAGSQVLKYGPMPVPTVPSTWGRIKRLVR